VAFPFAFGRPQPSLELFLAGGKLALQVLLGLGALRLLFLAGGLEALAQRLCFGLQRFPGLGFLFLGRPQALFVGFLGAFLFLLRLFFFGAQAFLELVARVRVPVLQGLAPILQLGAQGLAFLLETRAALLQAFAQFLEPFLEGLDLALEFVGDALAHVRHLLVQRIVQTVDARARGGGGRGCAAALRHTRHAGLHGSGPAGDAPARAGLRNRGTGRFLAGQVGEERGRGAEREGRDEERLHHRGSPGFSEGVGAGAAAGASALAGGFSGISRARSALTWASWARRLSRRTAS
jgi:hypothetical protein